MKNMMKKCAMLLALAAGVCGGLQAREITVMNDGWDKRKSLYYLSLHEPIKKWFRTTWNDVGTITERGNLNFTDDITQMRIDFSEYDLEKKAHVIRKSHTFDVKEKTKKIIVKYDIGTTSTAELEEEVGPEEIKIFQYTR